MSCTFWLSIWASTPPLPSVTYTLGHTGPRAQASPPVPPAAHRGRTDIKPMPARLSPASHPHQSLRPSSPLPTSPLAGSQPRKGLFHLLSVLNTSGLLASISKLERSKECIS